MANNLNSDFIFGLIVLLTTLSMTIFFELVAGSFFKFRTRKERGTVMLVNVITNPLANVFFALGASLMSDYGPASSSFYLVIILLWLILIEAAVIISEWKMYVYALKMESKKAFWASLRMNLFSLIVGVPIAFAIFLSQLLLLYAIIFFIIAIVLFMVFAKKSEASAVLMQKDEPAKTQKA